MICLLQAYWGRPRRLSPTPFQSLCALFRLNKTLQHPHFVLKDAWNFVTIVTAKRVAFNPAFYLHFFFKWMASAILCTQLLQQTGSAQALVVTHFSLRQSQKHLFFSLFLSCRRETVPVWVWGMRQKICKQQRPKETHARSHVGQAISLQNVRQVLHTSQLSTKTHEGK